MGEQAKRTDKRTSEAMDDGDVQPRRGGRLVGGSPKTHPDCFGGQSDRRAGGGVGG